MSSKSDHERADTSRPVAFATREVQSSTRETVEVTVYEQYQTSETNQGASPISGEGSLHDKPAGLELDYDMERGAESGT